MSLLMFKKLNFYELKYTKIFCGTPRYMAPEIIAKKEYLGTFADI